MVNGAYLFFNDDAFYLKALRLILKLYSLPPSKSFSSISNHFQQFPIISNNFQSFPNHSPIISNNFYPFLPNSQFSSKLSIFFQTLKFLSNSKFSFKL
ncbi:hypothetical protein FBF47_07535 [Helicobacter pylori]|nr:hypothetical protein [Helicobacter pylori]